MKYDPSKSYEWKPDEQFSISGSDFGLILNTIRSILSTEQAQQILLAARTNDVLEKIMAENVESGKVIEKEQQSKLKKV
jgi:hypothetical protein